MKTKIIVFASFITMISCNEKDLESNEVSQSSKNEKSNVNIEYRGNKMSVLKDADGNYLLNEDLILYENDVKELNNLGTVKLKSSSVNAWDLSEDISILLWPMTNLTFKIDPNISASQKQLIREATAQWGIKTLISFTETTGKENIYFKKVNSGCSAYPGFSGNDDNSIVNLSETCDLQSILHELGHVVGMIHEHQRTNRDDFITLPSKTFNHIKEKYSDNIYNLIVDNLKKEKSNLNDPYDFDFNSIMMYGSFPRNNLQLRDDLITNKFPLYTKINGQLVDRPITGLSSKDVNWVEYHYTRKIILKNTDYNVINLKIRLSKVSDPHTISLNKGDEIKLIYDKSKNKFTYRNAEVQQLDLNDGGSSDDINFSWNNDKKNITYSTNDKSTVILIKDYTNDDMTCYQVIDNDGINGGARNAIVEAIKIDNYTTYISLKKWSSKINTDERNHTFNPEQSTTLTFRNVNYPTLNKFKIRLKDAPDRSIVLSKGINVQFTYDGRSKNFFYNGSIVQQVDLNDGSSSDDIDFEWEKSKVKPYRATSHYSCSLIDLTNGYIYGTVDSDGIDGQVANAQLNAYVSYDKLYIDIMK